jgi:hypothetical protein
MVDLPESRWQFHVRSSNLLSLGNFIESFCDEMIQALFFSPGLDVKLPV